MKKGRTRSQEKTPTTCGRIYATRRLAKFERGGLLTPSPTSSSVPIVLKLMRLFASSAGGGRARRPARYFIKLPFSLSAIGRPSRVALDFSTSYAACRINVGLLARLNQSESALCVRARARARTLLHAKDRILCNFPLTRSPFSFQTATTAVFRPR